MGRLQKFRSNLNPRIGLCLTVKAPGLRPDGVASTGPNLSDVVLPSGPYPL